jgi:xanthine dehydrogenase accessory factor
VLILSHDHAEDFALCDAALRLPQLGTIGLIGSTTKWSGFRRRLAEHGHSAQTIDRIHCPIGLPDITGKHPAVIAISVAASLLQTMQRVQTMQRAQAATPPAAPVGTDAAGGVPS